MSTNLAAVQSAANQQQNRALVVVALGVQRNPRAVVAAQCKATPSGVRLCRECELPCELGPYQRHRNRDATLALDHHSIRAHPPAARGAPRLITEGHHSSAPPYSARRPCTTGNAPEISHAKQASKLVLLWRIDWTFLRVRRRYIIPMIVGHQTGFRIIDLMGRAESLLFSAASTVMLYI
jgi:hypothetical protein